MDGVLGLPSYDTMYLYHDTQLYTHARFTLMSAFDIFYSLLLILSELIVVLIHAFKNVGPKGTLLKPCRNRSQDRS